MLLKDIKTEYEKHRILECNKGNTKVYCLNAAMRPVYKNIYIGRPKSCAETPVCRIYVYYKEYDIGFTVFDRENINSSVHDVVSMVKHLRMSTAKEFMAYIDECILLHHRVEEFYLSVAEIIAPERRKFYMDIINAKNRLASIRIQEHKAMRKNNYIILKDECDKLNSMLDGLKNGGEILNDILVTDMRCDKYETFFGMVSRIYYHSLPDKIYGDFDAFLESVTIKDNSVVGIRTSKKKIIMKKAIETIIQKVRDENLKAIISRGEIILKANGVSKS